jgi:hypothetical protein
VVDEAVARVPQQEVPIPGQGWENWALLTDPEWRPESPDEAPPAEAMAGGWLLDATGKPGRFLPNPDFVPVSETSATDPVDAVLRLVARGDAPLDVVIPTLRDAFVEIAVTEDGYLLVGPAPDGAPCVGVVTAGVHRARLPFEHWRQVTAETVLEVLPEGTDILINPEGPAPFRLLAPALRESFANDPENERMTKVEEPKPGQE